MTMSATAWPFIAKNESGVPVIEGTSTKVIEVALDHLTYGWDAAQIHRQHSDLSLPQIHAALGYYFEHREECDQEIESRRLRADELLEKAGNRELQARLQRLKSSQSDS